MFDDNDMPIECSDSLSDDVFLDYSELEEKFTDAKNIDEEDQEEKADVSEQGACGSKDIDRDFVNKCTITDTQKVMKKKPVEELRKIVENVYKNLVREKDIKEKDKFKIKSSIWLLVSLFETYNVPHPKILTNNQIKEKIKFLRDEILKLENIIKYKEGKEFPTDPSKKALYKGILAYNKKTLKNLKKDFEELETEKDKRYRDYKSYTDQIIYFLELYNIFLEEITILQFIEKEFKNN